MKSQPFTRWRILAQATAASFLLMATLLLLQTQSATAAPVAINNQTTITATQVITASNPTQNAKAGYAVEINGDYALVGAINGTGNSSQTGVVYAHHFNGTRWQQTQRLFNPNGSSGEFFGQAIDMNEDGTIAVIGADKTNDNGNGSGAVFVYTRTGQTWTQTQKLLPSQGQADARFGYGVALDGNTLLVSAYRQDHDGKSNAGMVFVYEYDTANQVWQETAILTASDIQQGGVFGWDVALEGNTAVISAIFATNDDNNSKGNVYIFKRQPNGNWQQTQKLISFYHGGNLFGRAVELDGEWLLIGEPFSNRTHVYKEINSRWEHQTMLYNNGLLGYNLDIEGDTAVIGNPADTNNQVPALVWQESGGIWTQVSQLVPNTTTVTSHFFGSDVALDSNGRVIIGADRHNDRNMDREGLAFIYNQINPLPIPTTTVTLAPAELSTSEGMTITFTITRTGDLSTTLSMAYGIAPSGSHPATPADFGIDNGGNSDTYYRHEFEFDPGQEVLTFTIAISDDLQTEQDETFTVQLQNVVDAVAINGISHVTIPNDDFDATIDINPATQTLTEGETMTFTITATGSVTAGIPITYAVQGSGNNPASPADFASGAMLTGTVVVIPGKVTNIVLPTLNDSDEEPSEEFTILIGTSQPHIVLLKNSIQATILDNDAKGYAIYLPLVTR